LPLTRDERIARLSSTGLSDNQIGALVAGELDDDLLAGCDGSLDPGIPALPAKAWATALLEATKSSRIALAAAIHVREAGDLTKDGVEILVEAATKSNFSDGGALIKWITTEAETLDLKPADTGAVEAAVAEVLAERADFVAERGMGALGPLMGVVMGKLGGVADGGAVSAALKQALQKLTED
jgi:glutamyl-tRNA(Gln) amidotransferase subunit E